MANAAGNPSASSVKSPDAFRTISEVSEELGLPQHVLRFWETRFSQIRPLKRGGGRRLYRPDHIALLRGIKALLYDDGMTIKGVQKMLRERGQKAVIARGRSDGALGIQSTAPALPADTAERLAAIRAKLENAGGSLGTPAPAPAQTTDAPADETTEAEPELPLNGVATVPADPERLQASIGRLEAILARLERR